MAKSDHPFRRFDSLPEVIRLVVLMYVKCPLSLRNVEDLLAGRGIDICHEIVRLWWNRFGPMFAAEIRRKRGDHMRAYTHWRWHLPAMFLVETRSHWTDSTATRPAQLVASDNDRLAGHGSGWNQISHGSVLSHG